MCDLLLHIGDFRRSSVVSRATGMRNLSAEKSDVIVHFYSDTPYVRNDESHLTRR